MGVSNPYLIIKHICDDYNEETDPDGGISDWRNHKSDTSKN